MRFHGDLNDGIILRAFSVGNSRTPMVDDTDLTEPCFKGLQGAHFMISSARRTLTGCGCPIEIGPGVLMPNRHPNGTCLATADTGWLQ